MVGAHGASNLVDVSTSSLVEVTSQITIVIQLVGSSSIKRANPASSLEFQLRPHHAPRTSHSAEIEFMEEIRWASIALATSLDSSEDHRLVVMIFSFGTQLPI